MFGNILEEGIKSVRNTFEKNSVQTIGIPFYFAQPELLKLENLNLPCVIIRSIKDEHPRVHPEFLYKIERVDKKYFFLVVLTLLVTLNTLFRYLHIGFV